MKMTEAFVPSILLSEVYFPYLGTRGLLADAVAQAADEGFYRSVEITDIPDPSERRRIGQIVRANDIALTHWLTPLLASSRLDLSALDQSLRRHSVALLTQQMDPAAECGARAIAVASGPDPGPNLRGEATKAFFDSLRELAEAAQAYESMRIVFEPLDRGADKNGLIGPTDEAVALVRRVREEVSNVGLCWDSGHVALNGEDLPASFSASQPFISNIHFSNAVIDRDHPDFGDRHLPMGPPGIVSTEEMAQVLHGVAESEVFANSPPSVAVEIRNPSPGGEPSATWQLSKQTLQQAWSKATVTGESD